MANAYANIAFTSAVRAEQARHGSADIYARVLSDTRQDGDQMTDREAAFLQARDGVFQATVGETGWPYVQFRGGAPGFLKVIDPQTVAYADYSGNKQYISTGNLRDNDRISILAIDFAQRRRLKLLGHARITDDPGVINYLNPPDGPEAERAVVIRVAAFDWNCPKHIPVRRTDAEYGGEIDRLKARIAELEQMRFAST
ncbi:pyridoxamine 5'-phosphate oxidase family protein [Primorskyibacter sp. 2E233]|uniref:pyridoxamine 5'-phosphate oxidase family protein n=1 Tax=Primorskyibacter sp. 2E233 TaxID=3413431 RepID=UPI003BF0D3D9